LKREARRHVEQLEWAIRGALEELEKDPRQAYNKAFYAWREAVATAASILASNPALSERLRRLSAYEENRIIVTTSNAPRVLRALKEHIEEQHPLYEVLEELDTVRRDAYMLHTAFYEGVEHASFTGAEEAAETLRRVVSAAGDALRVVKSLLASRPREEG